MRFVYGDTSSVVAGKVGGKGNERQCRYSGRGIGGEVAKSVVGDCKAILTLVETLNDDDGDY